MGDPKKIPQPPKYGPKAPGPATLADWVSFWRWLVSLWSVASEAANAQEVIAITPRPLPSGSEQETLAAAQAIGASHPVPSRQADADGGAIQALQVRRETATRPDDLNALTLLALSRVQTRPQTEPTITTLEGPHADRGSAGTVNVSGTQLTLASGTPFQATMVGKLIAVAFVLYRVVSFTSPTVIDIDTNIGVGTTFFLYTAYPSSSYPLGSFFVELDRTLLYVSETSQGVVDTSGTTVTWISGDNFYPYWGQRASASSVVINGVSYGVKEFSDSITMILQSSAGVQSSVPYSVISGKWQYISGQYYESLTAIPDDLGPYDTGLLFFDNTYQHSYRWNWSLTSFEFAPGDPGAGFIVAGSPNLAGYAACTGGSVPVSVGDGTTASVTTPNMTGDVFIQGGSGGRQAATRATWEAGARTDFEDTHVHNVDLTPYSDTAAAGIDVSVVNPASFLSGPGSSHAHALTDADSQLKKFSEADGGLPLRIGLPWHMRQ